MSSEFENTYIASIQEDYKLKFGLIDNQGNWIIEPQFENLVKLNIKDYYKFIENNLRGIIDSKGNVIVEAKFDSLELLNDNFWVLIDNKHGLINDEEEYLIEIKYDSLNFVESSKTYNIGINGKYGIVNSDFKIYIEPIYDSLSDFDAEGQIIANLNGKYGVVNSKGEYIIDFRFDYIGFFDTEGFAIAKENDLFGIIGRNGEWILYPIYTHISTFNNKGYACVGMNSIYGVIDREGNWIIAPEFKKCESCGEYFSVEVENFIYGIIDIDKNWIIKPIFKSAPQFNVNGIVIININNKYGIMDENFQSVIVEPKYDYIYSLIGDKVLGFHLNNNTAKIEIKNNTIIEPSDDDFYDYASGYSNLKNKKNNSFYNIYNELVNVGDLDIIVGNFDKEGLAVAKSINGKYGILNSKGKWVLPAVYDILESFDEFGYAKASVKNKYGWIDIHGKWKIKPKFDILTFPNDIRDYGADMEFFIHQYFHFYLEDLKTLYLNDDIPVELKIDLNNNLEIDFKDNIEYLLFYDDSLDSTGKEAVAIVKKNDEFFLVFKERRKKPLILLLWSPIRRCKIVRFQLLEADCTLLIITTFDATLNDEPPFKYYEYKENYYSSESEMCKFYDLKFYNPTFLKVLVMFCENIDFDMEL